MEIVKTPEQPQHVFSPVQGEKQKARLKDWYTDGVVLCGYVFEHPQLPDWQFVQTSRVLWLDRQIKVAETLNTVYILENERR